MSVIFSDCTGTAIAVQTACSSPGGARVSTSVQQGFKNSYDKFAKDIKDYFVEKYTDIKDAGLELADQIANPILGTDGARLISNLDAARVASNEKRKKGRANRLGSKSSLEQRTPTVENPKGNSDKLNAELIKLYNQTSKLDPVTKIEDVKNLKEIFAVYADKPDADYLNSLFENDFDETDGIEAYLSNGTVDIGFITSITGGFEEAVKGDVGRPTFGSDQVYGRFTIEGVCFDRICPSSTESIKGNAEDRAGIEAIIAFFGHNRVTNRSVSGSSADATTRVNILIGQTDFEAYCIGVNFGIADPNLNLWRWSITLLVNPLYNIQPMFANQKIAAVTSGKTSQ